VLGTNGGSSVALYYGALSGSNVAGVTFSGTVSGGTSPAMVLNFGFPFETIYDTTARANVMARVLNFMVPVTTSRFVVE
jgi:hypothetical protein